MSDRSADRFSRWRLCRDAGPVELQGIGYKTVMINDTSFLRNKNYYKKSEPTGTLDFDKMKEVVDSTYNAITGLGK